MKTANTFMNAFSQTENNVTRNHLCQIEQPPPPVQIQQMEFLIDGDGFQAGQDLSVRGGMLYWAYASALAGFQSGRA